jgi:hypothetical protein
MSLARNPRAFDKARLLLGLLPHHSLEFYDRVLTMLEVRLERLWAPAGNYTPQNWQEAIMGASQALGHELRGYLEEPAAVDLEAQIRQQVEHLRSDAPFTFLHNADFRLARLCYAVCRAIKPALVVETGVAYGVTSAFLLRALATNGNGSLHSVDLPPLGRDADRFVGILIPDTLRQHWHLHRGPSKRVLPMLLAQLGQIDLFIHDSLHSYANMRWEFSTVAPYLQSPSVLIADDIEGNRAFEEWVQRTRPAFSATMREAEKQGICGLSVLR